MLIQEADVVKKRLNNGGKRNKIKQKIIHRKTFKKEI